VPVLELLRPRLARLDDARVGVEEPFVAVARHLFEQAAADEPPARAADDALGGFVGVTPDEVNDPPGLVAHAFEHHEAVNRSLLHGAEARFAQAQGVFGAGAFEARPDAARELL
jgi:hypothetical protein